jgi:hypothetical protein
MNLRKLAKDKSCTCCGCNDGTTVLHHIRVSGSGGTGLKPPDFPWGIRVCAACHSYLHGAGRADYRCMVTAMGRQMLVYEAEGVIRQECAA